MSTETKPFAKSLHTVSVLCKVARLLQQLGPYTPDGRPIALVNNGKMISELV